MRVMPIRHCIYEVRIIADVRIVHSLPPSPPSCTIILHQDNRSPNLQNDLSLFVACVFTVDGNMLFACR